MAREFDIDEYLRSEIRGTEEEEETIPQPEEPQATAFDLDDYLRGQLAPEQEGEVVNTPEEFVPPVQKKFERREDAESQEDLTYKERAGDEDYMDMLREYQKSRFGEDSAQGEDETNEEYLKRFVSQVR